MKTPVISPLTLLSIALLSAMPLCAAPPALPPPGPALAALEAKYGPHWAYKGAVLSFKAEAPLSEEAWKEIEALGAKAIYVGGKGIDDAALVRFARMPLEALSIDNSSLTEAGLAPLKEMKQLQSIGLSHALALKGPGLAAIASHPALTSVSVGGTGVGDAAMAPIASIKQLTKLGLNHDQVTDAGLTALANHPALEILMYSPQMTPRLTDESLKTVATLKALRELTINDTVLTYDGRESWEPPHAEDQRMLAAFHHHQRSDKGFGPAAGPEATEALAQAFRKAGTAVTVGESPWLLGADHPDLVRELAAGIAAAVAETGHVSPEAIASWLEAKRGASVTIGHQDLWARPV